MADTFHPDALKSALELRDTVRKIADGLSDSRVSSRTLLGLAQDSLLLLGEIHTVLHNDVFPKAAEENVDKTE